MSKVRLYGDTSGFVDLKAPDVASNVTITLPNTSGPFATEAYADAAVSGLATETYVDTAVAAIPEIAGIGSNVVQTVKTTAFTTTSTSFVNITGFAATITPTLATSKVLVVAEYSVGSSGDRVESQLLRGATVLGLFSFSDRYPSDPRSRGQEWPGISFLDSPATTSATTYQLRLRATSGTAAFNKPGGGYSTPHTCTITAIEVAA